MAIQTRRRATPLQVRLLNGAVGGSSQFFGVAADNLTETLHGLQDVEAIRKLSEGDPETFLAYWSQRQKTLSKTQPLYSLLQGYADRSTKKIATDKEDAEALADYARTNNHKAYLDHLLMRLDTATDPATIEKLSTQINTMRGRVFAAAGGGDSVASGVSKGDLLDAKQEFFAKRDEARAILMDNGTLSKDLLKELDQKATTYSDLLKKVIADTGVSSTARNDAYTQLYAVGNQNLEGTGPMKTVQLAKNASDRNAVQNAGFDSAGQSSFMAQVAATTDPKEKAKLWAKRAGQAEVLLQGVQSNDAAQAVATILSTTEENAQKAAAVLVATSKVLPEGASKRLEDLFSTYMKLGGTESEGTFKTKLQHAPDNETFGKAVGLSPKARQQFASVFNAAKEDAQAGMPAEWNPLSRKWEGDPERVADAEAASAVIKTILDLPGNIYDQQYGGQLTHSTLSDGDLVDLATGKYQMPQQATPQNPDVTDPTRHAPAAPSVETDPGMAAVHAEGGARDPFAEELAPSDPTAPTAGKKGLQSPMAPEVNSNEEFNQWSSAADNYLTEGNTSDLPEFTAPKPKKADLTEFFPFAAPERTGGRTTGEY